MHNIKSVCIYKFAGQTTLAFLVRIEEDCVDRYWSYFYDDKSKGNEIEMTCSKSSLSEPIVNKELCSWD